MDRSRYCADREPHFGEMEDDLGVLWRSVPGTAGTYAVSETGQVMSCARLVPYKGRNRCGITEDTILAQSVNGRGYQGVSICLDGKVRTRLVHQLVAEAFLGVRPAGADVCHYDDVKDNNRTDNLRYGSHSDNMLDAVRNGTHRSSAKTHCPRGHELNGDNLVKHRLKAGRRGCRSCYNARTFCRRHPEADFETEADRFYARYTADDQYDCGNETASIA